MALPCHLVFYGCSGKREELHDMARRLATTGYYVVLPNLYYRTTDHFELDFETGSNVEEMFTLMAGIGNRMVVRDTEAILNFLKSDDNADEESIGCVGYCMSGPFSLYVASVFPSQIQLRNRSIYGVRLVVDADDSPHLGFPQTKAELYIACAEHDEYVPLDMIEQVSTEIEQSGVNGRVELYEGTHHGFAFRVEERFTTKRTYERHWERLHALFDRNLR